MASLRRCKFFLAAFCLIGLSSARSCDEKSKRNTADDFDVLLSRMKRDEGFRKKFDPLPLSVDMGSTELPSSYKALHGLSDMQNVSQYSYKLDQDRSRTVLNFQYPKLCVKCNNTDPKDQGFGRPMSIGEECFLIICAKNTKGRLEIIGAQHTTTIKAFSIDKLQFEIEADKDRRRNSQLNISQIEERVKSLLPLLEEKLNAMLNSGDVAAELSMYLYMAKRREREEACKNVTSPPPATTTTSTTIKPTAKVPPQNVADVIDRMLKLIRYDSEFQYRFDPFRLDIKPCFFQLHGLSHMRKISHNSSYTDEGRLRIFVKFQYPELCLKCLVENLPNNTVNGTKGPGYQVGKYTNVCARYVGGEIDIEGPEDLRSLTVQNIRDLKVVYFSIKKPAFYMDITGSTIMIPERVIPFSKIIELYLPSLSEQVHSLLKTGVLIDGIWKYMVEAFIEAGNCSLGNCSHLEDKTDFEFIEALSSNLRAETSHHHVQHPHPMEISIGKYQVLIQAFRKVEGTEIVWYDHGEILSRKLHYMFVTFQTPKVCLTCLIRHIQNQNASEFLMCAKNVRSQVKLRILNSPTELIVPEEVQAHTPTFDIILTKVDETSRNVLTDPSFKTELEEQVKKQKMYSYLYKDFISSKIKSFSSEFQQCYFGKCFMYD